MEEVAEELQEYRPDIEQDALILQWWGELVTAGELDKVFSDRADTPSGFFNLLQAPTGLLYTADEKGIKAAFWFEPFMVGALFGLWIRKDFRQRKWWNTGLTAIARALHVVPIIVFVTANPTVVADATDCGFTIVGDVPYILRGKTATVGYITREEFFARYKHLE